MENNKSGIEVGQVYYRKIGKEVITYEVIKGKYLNNNYTCLVKTKNILLNRYMVITFDSHRLIKMKRLK